ncbi:MarR family winged helix-turn-helix transcriptional regulator [Pseudomonas anguilliseptica]|uniref:MarR family winged helix-turn-helix transcriptional regulator n=1 Tax=Pseudomonas anguilliseptica TaxID=53406 RepID=UPI0022AE625D|nr:MarR family transcriptional regulator [Pseudomonas anguilliseptica]MCZ4321874.1 MarR family transcriptional regulator [Pseudomonas anguilliseptica]
MHPSRPADAVDLILQQWAQERPDLDVSPMGVIGRIGRCSALLRRELLPVFERFGLSAWEFDVLATLRRSGAPYCLAPTALFSALMITSGTMTRQLQQLEAAGRISRIPNPSDARSLLVQLTPAGLELIDLAVGAHVDNEARILAALPVAIRNQLDDGLSALLAILEPVQK